MLEMSSLGSKVMQTNSVQDARLNRIDVHVRSSFTNRSGTHNKKNNIKNNKIIRISFTKNDAKITLVGVKDRPGIAASIFEPLSKNNINVDMVVQNISANGSETDITFTVKNEDLKKSVKTLKNNNLFKYKKILVDDKVSKVSIIGVGMITTPGVTYRMFKSLSKKKINILVISTSEIKISVLIKRSNVKKAVAALHKEFNLSKYEHKTLQKYKRKNTKLVNVGKVKIGNLHPISVQSMTNTQTTDTKATITQINNLAKEGADLVRVSVPDKESSVALKEIVKYSMYQ